MSFGALSSAIIAPRWAVSGREIEATAFWSWTRGL
jgi:hypothetical protein